MSSSLLQNPYAIMILLLVIEKTKQLSLALPSNVTYLEKIIGQ